METATVQHHNQLILPEDPEELLNVWLGELDNLTLGLDRVSSYQQQGQGKDEESNSTEQSHLRPLTSDPNLPRIDSLRYSMANMEDTQDVDLDAILGELCALESQYEEAIRSTNLPDRKSVEVSPVMQSPNSTDKHNHASSRLSQASSISGAISQTSSGQRTHSPDNDSAFSDSVSLLSSESSTSGGRHVSFAETPTINGAGTSKAEKIRLAIQKIKEASVKKIFIKVFNDDGSVKSLLVDETMTCGYITRVLAEKNHRLFDPRCALVEHLTDLHMERVYEDTEILVTELMRWTYSSKNRLHFTWDRADKTLLVDAPWLFTGCNSEGSMPPHHHGVSPRNLAMLEDFFTGSGVPCVEGPLYIKTDSRKGWKKFQCILRSSGLYYWPKDKAKCSSKDLICLATFDLNTVYYGVGWKKRFKAPTDYCFALKPPSVQEATSKTSKYIKCLSAPDLTSLHTWVTAIRTAKYGHQLLNDYRTSLKFCDHDELTTPRIDKSSASSVISSSSSSSGCDVGFESEFPCGTIKRKPAKLPLTTTTRQLKSAAIGEEEMCDEDLPPPPPELMVDDDDDDDEPRTLFVGTSRNPEFLKDLHRVVEKKWQVAEKCRLETGTTPHQVLGFRHYDRSQSVSKWIEEHYGDLSAVRTMSTGSAGSPRNRLSAPPPPPPRAPTTVLTRRITILKLYQNVEMTNMSDNL